MTKSPRIATVFLNSAIDRTVTTPRFAVDTVNRVKTVRADAGGKGVNVASFLAHFGHEVLVTGRLRRDNEAPSPAHFADTGLTDACLPAVRRRDPHQREDRRSGAGYRHRSELPRH